MLTTQQLTVVRAALRYWEEEMCQHGQAAIQPYLDSRTVIALTAAEVVALRARFQPSSVRYALYDTAADRLTSNALLRTQKAAQRQAATHKNQRVVTVLLPAAS